MKTGSTPSEKFQNLLTSLKGKMIWDTRTTLDGEKVVLECWSVPPRDYQTDTKHVIIQRRRDGSCDVFRQSSVGEVPLKQGLDDLENWLLFHGTPHATEVVSS